MAYAVVNQTKMSQLLDDIKQQQVNHDERLSISHDTLTKQVYDLTSIVAVRADLGGHLKYSRRWSGVRAGVLLGAQGAVRRGGTEEGCESKREQGRSQSHSGPMSCLVRTEGVS